MRFKTTIAFAVTLACLLLLTASCSRTKVYHGPTVRAGHGPPAHAPAHGYRRKQVSGVELTFDSGRGVYIVVGHPNCYYHDGYFYRLSGTVWEMSLKFDAGWARVSGRSLPRGLQAKGKSNGNDKANKSRNGKAKGKRKRPS